MNDNSILTNINKSITVITDELIPHRYNSISKVKIEIPESTGINSTTTIKIQNKPVHRKEEQQERDQNNQTNITLKLS